MYFTKLYILNTGCNIWSNCCCSSDVISVSMSACWAASTFGIKNSANSSKRYTIVFMVAPPSLGCIFLEQKKRALPAEEPEFFLPKHLPKALHFLPIPALLPQKLLP